MLTLLEKILSVAIVVLTAYSAYLNSKIAKGYVSKSEFLSVINKLKDNQQKSSDQHKEIFREINKLHHEVEHTNNNIKQQGKNVEIQIKELESKMNL